MGDPYLDGQESLLDRLQTMFLPAGAYFEIKLAAADLLSDAQAAYLSLQTRAQVTIQNISQRVTKITGARIEGRRLPPELGDAEITIAGVPSAGGSAAAAVSNILRGLAAVGAAAALVSFTTKSDDVAGDVQETAKAVGIPIILILLLLLLLLHEWNKVKV